jgi:preprotein translocase subunit SecD
LIIMKAPRWQVKILLLLVLVSLSSVQCALEPEPRPGMTAVLAMESDERSTATAETQARVMEVLRQRMKARGNRGRVTAEGEDRVLLELEAVEGRDEAAWRTEVQSLIQPARLEFIWLRNVRRPGPEPAGDPAARYEARVEEIWDTQRKRILSSEEVREEILYSDRSSIILTGENVIPGRAATEFRGAGLVTLLKFDKEGTRRLAEFTHAHVGSLLAIVIDGEINSVPRIQEPIQDGEIAISGGGGPDDAQTLADLFNSGSLPVPLRIVSLEVG